MTVSPVSSGRTLPDDYKNEIPLSNFHGRVVGFFPSLTIDDLARSDDPNTEVGSRVGIIADLEGHSDFMFEFDPKYGQCLNLMCLESPAMTSSLAIAVRVEQMLEEKKFL